MSEPLVTTHPFSDWIDLASERLGGKAVLANDEFFAPKGNLVKAKTPIFLPDKYVPTGKWMDGWESRRRRTPGNDWCVIKLGVPGVLHGINVNTAFFLGNYPEHCSLDALYCTKPLSAQALASPTLKWKELVTKSALKGGSDNYFAIQARNSWTHVRLNIYPDGGVARLRVYGEVTPDWKKLRSAKSSIDLVAIANGGKVITCNDMFFGAKDNLILPGRALNMGDGWETKRKRGPGYDWIVVRLGTSGRIKKMEVDTKFFKGNFPESCSIEGCVYPQRDISPSAFNQGADLSWKEILPRTKLKADHQHFFQKELNQKALEVAYDYLRLNIFPDGGIGRLRVFGDPA